MVRRPTEARLMYSLRHHAAGFLPDMPDYTNRLSRRTKEWRLARLLSGWPALVEDAEEAVSVPRIEEPRAEYRGAACPLRLPLPLLPGALLTYASRRNPTGRFKCPGRSFLRMPGLFVSWYQHPITFKSKALAALSNPYVLIVVPGSMTNNRILARERYIFPRSRTQRFRAQFIGPSAAISNVVR